MEEREKIEWCIGAILSGDSKRIQKFAVFYGPPGSGKGTVLKIIGKLFVGYTTSFDAKALGNSNSQFATEVFKNDKNLENAKKFVAFLLKEENLRPYVEGSLGRWFPVTKEGMESPFWQEDPHRKSVYNQYAAGTVTFEFTKNYKFTVLNNENVWAKAMNRVVNEKVPVDKAVDEMIARIKTVAGAPN